MRRARWDLQHRFSSMQLHSPLSATARPFQPGATLSSALVDDTPQDYPAWDGLMRSSPPQGSTRGLPVREATPNHHYTSNEEGVSTDNTTSEKSSLRDGVAEEAEVTGVVATPMSLSTLEGDERKRIDFLVRSKSLNSEVRRVILMMWPTPVTIMRIPISCP